MSIFEAIILGLVQGLTEFLPVSSSGHLVLLQKFFGIAESNLFFTVMLHLGTLIAVLLVFWKDIWFLITHPTNKLTLYLIVSTVVTGIIYIILGKIVNDSYSGQFLAWGFLYTAAILFVTGRIQTGKKGKNMNGTDAAIIGFMQGIALFPGVSRSGSTIAGGLFVGLDKEFASRYSFILSIPAILAGAVMELKDIGSMSSVPWGAVIVGVIVATVSGLFAINVMLQVIKRQKLSYFSVYLVILAVIILADQWFFHIVF